MNNKRAIRPTMMFSMATLLEFLAEADIESAADEEQDNNSNKN
jgi:hypothetical protein